MIGSCAGPLCSVRNESRVYPASPSNHPFPTILFLASPCRYIKMLSPGRVNQHEELILRGRSTITADDARKPLRSARHGASLDHAGESAARGLASIFL